MKKEKRYLRGKRGFLAFLLISLLFTGCMGNGEPMPGSNIQAEHNPSNDIRPTTPPVGENASSGTFTDKEHLLTPAVEPGGQTTPLPTENDTGAGELTPDKPEVAYTVVLDPGHGGIFSGAIYKLVEKEVALSIAIYAKEYLEANYPQLSVYLTREADTEFDKELSKDLEKRVQLGKELGADVFVSLHLNASANHDVYGAEVLCPHRENVKTESFLLGNCILDELSTLGLRRRGIVTRNSNDTVDANGNPVEYYAINRHAANRDMVGIIVEHCFMDHEEDGKYLEDEAALRRLAEADARGIAAYFGLSYE